MWVPSWLVKWCPYVPLTTSDCFYLSSSNTPKLKHSWAHPAEATVLAWLTWLIIHKSRQNVHLIDFRLHHITCGWSDMHPPTHFSLIQLMLTSHWPDWQPNWEFRFMCILFTPITHTIGVHIHLKPSVTGGIRAGVRSDKVSSDKLFEPLHLQRQGDLLPAAVSHDHCEQGSGCWPVCGRALLLINWESPGLSDWLPCLQRSPPPLQHCSCMHANWHSCKYTHRHRDA